MNTLAPTVKNAFTPASSDRSAYQGGFGNEFIAGALPGALPRGQNSPQKTAYGLYAEQISGTALTAPRVHNRRSWFYRIYPDTVYLSFEVMAQGCFHSNFNEVLSLPSQLRWDSLPAPAAGTDFIDGIMTFAGNGGPDAQTGCGIHLYAANVSMAEHFFYNVDDEPLIAPQQGRLRLLMEMGVVDAELLEIVVVLRGVYFRVELPDGDMRSYICKNFGALFRLSDLGVIGSNGLTNPRDFLTPHARYENHEGNFKLVAKFQGNLWTARIDHSPLDVATWYGGLAPYKYDLRLFNTIGSISYDHLDPSISLVPQSPSDVPGMDTVDLMIFPPRWLATENTLRPPWLHRNVASGFMGLIQGIYDAETEGLVPGDASLHNCMSDHDPSADTFEKASNGDTAKPHKIDTTMAFVFEMPAVIRPTRFAAESAQLQAKYLERWQGLERHFNPTKR